MSKLHIQTGILHNVPKDIRNILEKDPDLREIWNDLTSIARNEWICWVTIVKKEETHKDHLKRLQEDLKSGKKRPCCWPGCPHRNPKAKKYFK